jgi:hypothetical protein
LLEVSGEWRFVCERPDVLLRMKSDQERRSVGMRIEASGG